MEASDRKHAWLNLEDEFWELEIRWKWLHKKARQNFAERNGRLMNCHEDGGTCSKQEEHTSTIDSTHDVKSLPDTFSKFCLCVYNAVHLISSAMDTIRKLMWLNWENDTICEALYDAIHFSHQLLESLATTWSISFSLFRTQGIELLYKAEKLVSQSISSHELSLKFLTECWQTYLATHSSLDQLNAARVKVKESVHSVGELFANSLALSHSLIVFLTQTSEDHLHHFNENENMNKEYENMNMNKANQQQGQEGTTGSEQVKMTTVLPVSVVKADTDQKSDSQNKISVKSSGSKNKIGGKSLTENEKTELLQLKMRLSDIPSVVEVNFCENIQSKKDEKCPVTKSSNLFNKIGSYFKVNQKHYESPAELKLPFPTTRNKYFIKSVSTLSSNTPKCKCCCRNSIRSSLDPNECGSSSKSNTTSSSQRSEIEIRDWVSLIEDLKDLKTEWGKIALSSYEDLSFYGSTSEGMNTTISANPHVKEETLTDETEVTIYKEMIYAIDLAIESSLKELQDQMEAYKQKEKYEFENNMKGFNAKETILQAKSLNFHLTQSLFSLILLASANSQRRILRYSSLLPESIAESRKHVYNLVYRREYYCAIPTNQYSSSTNQTKYNMTANPHTISQHLALALYKAHALSSLLISSLGKNDDLGEEVKVE